MADIDDAESPIGERDAPSRAPTRAGGPLGKAWGWFNAQPAQTKVIVIGVIVVLGVVVWMALRKKAAPTTDENGDDILSGAFRPLGANRYGPGGQAASPTALPPPVTGTTSGSTSQPAATAPKVTPPISPGVTPARAPITATATVTATPLQTPTVTPTAIRPAALFPVTPLGATTPPTLHRTDVPLSGTIIPLDDPTRSPSPTPTPIRTATQIVPIAFPRTGPTPQTTRPTVISAVPTQRGTNVSF